MSDALYSKPLLRLAADAAGAGRLTKPDCSATLHNPACGDRITLDLDIADGRIAALGHQTRACILTQASAAVLAQSAIGADRAQIARLADEVAAMLKGAEPVADYAAFNGVAGHPGRHVCVLLPLKAALEAFDALELTEPGR